MQIPTEARTEKMLAQENRIKKTGHFKGVFLTGQKVFGRYVIIFYRANQTQNSKFGIVASKKVGKAVIRNRAKRQIREIIRENWIEGLVSYDVVVVARSSIAGKRSDDIKKDLFINLKKAGIWRENSSLY